MWRRGTGRSGTRGSRPVYKSVSGLTGACQLSQIALGEGAAEGRKGHPACVRPRRPLGAEGKRPRGPGLVGGSPRGRRMPLTFLMLSARGRQPPPALLSGSRPPSLITPGLRVWELRPP